MFERLVNFFLTEPRRLVSLGALLARTGGALIIAGFVGQLATTAASAVKGLAGGPRPDVLLADVLPGYLSVWMPESIPGFAFALLLVVSGVWAARTGRTYEHYVGH
ncbi:hypothetical protein [Aquincola sp. J276]|uniref:hypothetical protein n=1 Tax=Aquincola sp. J276 TaxID=2898432 RepID=UPI002151F9E3|nr:hypothetical protein [Aquincola sp. J276]MCR5867643.1 hypothetical protein [Aquincola sp. J276]